MRDSRLTYDAEMESPKTAKDRLNQTGIDFLFIELDTAFTLLELASVTTVVETRVRNRRNALVAYETILRFAPLVTLTGDQKQQFDERLHELSTSLLEA